tara:strand:+ start:3558 stop:4673 length:1116 start_codon:yes stop_codon:yes gene_type:complete
MNHPIINHLCSRGSLDTKLESFTKKHRVMFKRHGSLIIGKYKQEAKYGSEIERMCRGVIIDTDSNSLVCPSIIGDISYEDFKNIVPFKYLAVEENIEGTLINLYFWNNRWNVSTKFNINADESRFRSLKTYRQVFDSVFDWKNIEPRLDTNFSYSFVLSFKENKLVTPINETKLHHVETINRVTGEKVFINIGVPHPKIHYVGNTQGGINNTLGSSFCEYTHLEDLLSKLDFTQRGYMLYSLDRKYRCSLINPKYLKVLNMVKDQSDIRYLAFESIYYKKNAEELLKYCPEHRKTFNDVELEFNTFVKNLYALYVNKYCYRQTVKYENKLGKSLKLIHKEYRESRINITYEKAEEIILGQDCPYLYCIIFK